MQERKPSSIALDNTTNIFLATINAITDLMHLIDVDYRIIFMNKSCLETAASLGFKDDVIGKKITEVYPFLEKNVLAEYEQVFKQKKELVTEEFYIFQNKEYYSQTLKIPIIEKGKVNSIITIIRDITEFKKSSLALEESEGKYRAAFYTSPDAVNINTIEGVFVDINEGFTNLTGYKSEEVIGRSSLEVNIWAKPEQREQLIKVLNEQGQVENLEALFRLKDGTIKTGLMSARIIKLNNKPHILSVTRDISDRKKMEGDLIAEKEKAEENDRLKTAFLQNMSHEIRTPLNGILGFTELLKNPRNTFMDIENYTRIISESGFRLLTVVNDILDISRIETGQIRVKPKSVNINKLLKNIQIFFTPKAEEKNLDLILDQKVNENLITNTDEDLLRQILENLLSNALKYTHRGSINFGYRIHNNYLEFHVKDTGIGIEKKYHHVIFNRFQQADISLSRQYGGTGLGLSISRGLVELLGGNICLKSEPGSGTTFIFTIPYKEAEVEKIDKLKKTNETNVNFDFTGYTILIAEDEVTNFQYIESVLKSSGADILHAWSGKEAVRIFKTNPQINLILMDIKMSEMSGYEATAIIKSLNPDIPVIAQTAFAMSEDREKTLDAGCDDYISKPMTRRQLLEIIHRNIHKDTDK